MPIQGFDTSEPSLYTSNKAQTSNPWYSPKSKVTIVNVTVVSVMFRDGGQVGGELVGRAQHLHRAGRQLPDEPLLVRHLVLAVVLRQDLGDNTVTVEEAAVGDL